MIMDPPCQRSRYLREMAFRALWTVGEQFRNNGETLKGSEFIRRALHLVQFDYRDLLPDKPQEKQRKDHKRMTDMPGDLISMQDLGIRILLGQAAGAAADGRCDFAETLYRQALRKAEFESHNLLQRVIEELACFLEDMGRASDAAGVRSRLNSDAHSDWG